MVIDPDLKEMTKTSFYLLSCSKGVTALQCSSLMPRHEIGIRIAHSILSFHITSLACLMSFNGLPFIYSAKRCNATLEYLGMHTHRSLTTERFLQIRGSIDELRHVISFSTTLRRQCSECAMSLLHFLRRPCWFAKRTVIYVGRPSWTEPTAASSSHVYEYSHTT